MQIAIYLPFALAAILGLAVPAISRGLAPSASVRTLAVAGALTAATTLSSLLLLTVVSLAELGILLQSHDAARLLQGRELVPEVIAVVAPALCGWYLIKLRRAATALRRGYQAADRILAGLPEPAGSPAIAADEQPYAFAVAGARGTRGRILVSTAMLNALDEAQRQVLLAHEHAHLRHRHHLYRSIARLTAAHPLLQRLAGHIDYGLERWADEDAAQHVGDRALVAQALGTAVLALASTRPAGQPRVTALNFARGRTADRMAALLEPPTRTRRHVQIVTTTFALAAVYANLDAIHDLIGLLALNL